MNRKQKIVLIIGAILLLLVIFTTPTVFTIHGSEGRVVQVNADSSWGKDLARRGYHKSVDLKTGMLRGAGVIVATLFAWYALRDSKRKNRK